MRNDHSGLLIDIIPRPHLFKVDRFHAVFLQVAFAGKALQWLGGTNHVVIPLYKMRIVIGQERGAIDHQIVTNRIHDDAAHDVLLQLGVRFLVQFRPDIDRLKQLLLHPLGSKLGRPILSLIT